MESAEIISSFLKVILKSIMRLWTIPESVSEYIQRWLSWVKSVYVKENDTVVNVAIMVL